MVVLCAILVAADLSMVSGSGGGSGLGLHVLCRNVIETSSVHSRCGDCALRVHDHHPVLDARILVDEWACNTFADKLRLPTPSLIFHHVRVVVMMNSSNSFPSETIKHSNESAPVGQLSTVSRVKINE